MRVMELRAIVEKKSNWKIGQKYFARIDQIKIGTTVIKILILFRILFLNISNNHSESLFFILHELSELNIKDSLIFLFKILINNRDISFQLQDLKCPSNRSLDNRLILQVCIFKLGGYFDIGEERISCYFHLELTSGVSISKLFTFAVSRIDEPFDSNLDKTIITVQNLSVSSLSLLQDCCAASRMNSSTILMPILKPLHNKWKTFFLTYRWLQGCVRYLPSPRLLCIHKDGQVIISTVFYNMYNHGWSNLY